MNLQETECAFCVRTFKSRDKGQRVEDKTAWAVDWLRLYAPDLLRSYGERL